MVISSRVIAPLFLLLLLQPACNNTKDEPLDKDSSSLLDADSDTQQVDSGFEPDSQTDTEPHSGGMDSESHVDTDTVAYIAHWTKDDCLNHSADNPACKDCCDCLPGADYACDTHSTCRNECAVHDFSENSDIWNFEIPTTLGETGAYSACIEEGDYIACKNCCCPIDQFVCGDYRHCRDACFNEFGE